MYRHPWARWESVEVVGLKAPLFIESHGEILYFWSCILVGFLQEFHGLWIDSGRFGPTLGRS